MKICLIFVHNILHLEIIKVFKCTWHDHIIVNSNLLLVSEIVDRFIKR